MNNSEINIVDFVSDDDLEKIGYTKETFKGSNTEALLKAMLLSFEKTVQEEIQSLMKNHSLSYGEARSIAFNRVFNAVANGLKGD